MKTINFRNEVQRVLFQVEIKGQLSDGMWENTRPWNHWMNWCQAEVKVDPNNLGMDFEVWKDNYNLVSKDLLDAVGDRMCWYAKLATKGYPIEIISELGDYENYYERGGSRSDYWKEKDALMKKVFETYDNLKAEREGYSLKDLKKELTDMKKIMRNTYKRYNK